MVANAGNIYLPTVFCGMVHRGRTCKEKPGNQFQRLKVGREDWWWEDGAIVIGRERVWILGAGVCGGTMLLRDGEKDVIVNHA